ncbi:odorant receptor 4-like isoform X2 [Ooceraea biroi]|uniref:odorant receptor 4-like isoform X2 n=1 Tax=Ooceraea biroi TaxID=2015173 RepID=UPI000F078664|nr:odorant receptor 4-like isoform X2 [Ooceraea biroi]
MICIETQHFNINRILMLAVGLWPYQRSKFVEFHVFICYSILVSFIIFQVKSLLEQLQHICNELKDENEIAIIKKCGNNAKCYTIILLLFAVCCIFTIILMPIWSRIVDNILLTELQSHRVIDIFNTEYFIDEEKYYYLILLHFYATISIGGIALVATGTMLIAYFKHICGMFSVASYRIEKAMTINMLKDNTLENWSMTYKEIIYAVDIHRKALNFTGFLMSNINGSIFFFILISVVCLSLHLFQIFQLVSHKGDIVEILIHFLFITAIFMYMFLSNYAGQEVTDNYNRIFFTTYNVLWYIAPLHIQRLLLFILQRGSKNFGLKVGGLLFVSLECLASLTSTSISYFTVMCSTQK